MKKLTCLIFTISFLLVANAQVYTTTYKTPRVSMRGFFGKINNIKTINLPMLSNESLLKDVDKKNDKGKKFEFAKAEKVSIDVLKDGSVEKINHDTLVYRVRILSKGALSTSIDFDEFYLTEDAVMYIYNNSGTMVTGPVYSSENNGTNSWGSSFYDDESLIVELKVPEKSKDRIKLHIGNFSHGFSNIFNKGGQEFGQSGPCEINVMCPLGSGWENERGAVALVLNATSSSMSSGVLLNNTCNNLVPYFYSAYHTFQDPYSGSVGNWKFIFRYWSPTCTPNQDGSRTLLFNGATYLDGSTLGDYLLLKLNQLPSSNSGITYAGWARNVSAPTFVTGIHHPKGDVMKISRSNSSPTLSAYLGYFGGDHWQVAWDGTNNLGVTERGSSGSPLFDENHRVIGELHGGNSACGGTDLRDWYGTFDAAWTGLGTGVRSWLDPSNSGTLQTNTIGANYHEMQGNSQLCTQETYSITNLAPGATVNWTISPSGIVNRQDNGNTITLTRITDGNITLTGTVNICGYNLQRSLTIAVGGPQVSISANKTGCSDVQFDVSGTNVSSYSWTADGDILFNGTSQTATTSVPTISASGTFGSVTVSTATVCGIPVNRQTSIAVEKPAPVGSITIDGIDPTTGAVCPNTESLLTALPPVIDQDITYEWFLPSDWVALQTGTNTATSQDYNLPVYPGNDGSISVWRKNSCGHSDLFTVHVTFDSYCGYYAISPNPATDNITIDGQKQKKDIIEVQIIDKTGQVRKVAKFAYKVQRVNMDVSGLSPNIYYIKIFDGKQWVSKPVRIN